MSGRNRISLLLGVLLLGVTLVPMTAAAAAPAGPARTSLTTAQFESKLLALTNARRVKIGCPKVKANTALTKAARAHSKLMAKAKNLSHQLPGEAGLAPRIVKAGYKNWAGLAENIAWGGGTPAAVFAMWMKSPMHKANIQRCFYRDAGFGVVVSGGSTWVTLDLGRRR